MQSPGTPSLILLLYVLVLVPWMAIGSAQKLAAAQKGDHTVQLPSPSAIWTRTMVMLLLLLAFAWIVGSSFGFEPFGGVREIRLRDVGFAGLALGSFFLMRLVMRAFRSDEERKKLMVFRLRPRNSTEWAVWSVMVFVASVSEEVVYRGVTMSILWYSLGNPWIAALICALAFAAAHWPQGFKSGVMIFAIALVMQGLVAITGTLVLAMIVHAIYDLIARYLIGREAHRFELEEKVAG